MPVIAHPRLVESFGKSIEQRQADMLAAMSEMTSEQDPHAPATKELVSVLETDAKRMPKLKRENPVEKAMSHKKRSFKERQADMMAALADVAAEAGENSPVAKVLKKQAHKVLQPHPETSLVQTIVPEIAVRHETIEEKEVGISEDMSSVTLEQTGAPKSAWLQGFMQDSARSQSRHTRLGRREARLMDTLAVIAQQNNGDASPIANVLKQQTSSTKN
jgi:hypothetical protein